MEENSKLKIVVIENEDLKQMVAKLEDEIRECKQHSLETNGHIYKIELKKVMSREKMDTEIGNRRTLPYVGVKRKCRY